MAHNSLVYYETHVVILSPYVPSLHRNRDGRRRRLAISPPISPTSQLEAIRPQFCVEGEPRPSRIDTNIVKYTHWKYKLASAVHSLLVSSHSLLSSPICQHSAVHQITQSSSSTLLVQLLCFSNRLDARLTTSPWSA